MAFIYQDIGPHKPDIENLSCPCASNTSNRVALEGMGLGPKIDFNMGGNNLWKPGRCQKARKKPGRSQEEARKRPGRGRRLVKARRQGKGQQRGQEARKSQEARNRPAKRTEEARKRPGGQEKARTPGRGQKSSGRGQEARKRLGSKKRAAKRLGGQEEPGG